MIVRIVRLARGAAVVLACLGLGWLLARVLPVPAPILGMLCLLVLLFATHRIAAMAPLRRDIILLADTLLSHIVLFLLPVSVGALLLLLASDKWVELLFLLVFSLPFSLLVMTWFLLPFNRSK